MNGINCDTQRNLKKFGFGVGATEPGPFGFTIAYELWFPPSWLLLTVGKSFYSEDYLYYPFWYFLFNRVLRENIWFLVTKHLLVFSDLKMIEYLCNFFWQSGRISSMDFHKTSNYLVTASNDESIRLYDVANATYASFSDLEIV